MIEIYVLKLKIIKFIRIWHAVSVYVCLSVRDTIFSNMRFNIESRNFRHRSWEVQGRTLLNISKIGLPGTALRESQICFLV